MPACGLQRGSKRGPSTARLHQHRPKTLARGQASRGGRQGASLGTATSGGLARRRRVQGRVPREVPMTQAMTTKGAGRAPAAQCPSFLFGARGASVGESIKQRHPFRCNKTKTSPTAGRKSLWSPSRRHHQSLWQAKTTFVRISVLAVPLQISLPLLAPFPLNIWEEDQGLYK